MSTRPSYLEKVRPDGSIEPLPLMAHGGFSGDSYLWEEVPEIDVAAIKTGACVFCLAVVEGCAIKDGTHSVERFGLSVICVPEFPAEVVFTVLTAITKHFDSRLGYYVSLFFDGVEKSRIAVNALERQDKFTSSSFAFAIGAYFENEGLCKIVAHASGFTLCETAIELRPLSA